MNRNKVGDLVHLPQASRLLNFIRDEHQESIPWDTIVLDEPKVALVSGLESTGYVQVYWEGKEWSVREEDVFVIRES